MLIGQTVALRPVEKADLSLLAGWWSDPRMFEPDEARWPTRAADLEARIAKKPNYDKAGEFVVVLSETLGTDNETIVGHYGFLTPSRIPALRCFEIGFSTHPNHRRKGYATIAGRLLVNQLFNATIVHRIQAHCRTTNIGSQRVTEGIGMTREATLRSCAYVGGTYHDVHLYSILRPEWADSEAYTARFGGL